MLRLPPHRIAILAVTILWDCGTPDTGAVLDLSIRVAIESGVDTSGLSRIAGIAAAVDGRVYVADGLLKAVRIYDGSGKFVTEIGRPGDGPGEFRAINSIGVRGRHLAVYDGSALRVTLFDRHDLAVVGTIAVRDALPDLEWGGGAQIRFLSDSTFALGVRVPREAEARSRGGVGDGEARVYGVDGFLHSRVRVSTRDYRMYLFRTTEHGSLQLRMPIPYEPWTVWSVGPTGGATSAWGGLYAIHEIDVQGDTTRVIARDVPPVALDSVNLNRAKAFVNGFLEVARAVPEARDVALPKSQQQITGLSYSADGQWLWVRRTDWAPDPSFDVFDDGRYHCSVRLLAGGLSGHPVTTPLTIVGARAYLRAIGRLDLESVLVYDIGPVKACDLS